MFVFRPFTRKRSEVGSGAINLRPRIRYLKVCSNNPCIRVAERVPGRIFASWEFQESLVSEDSERSYENFAAEGSNSTVPSRGKYREKGM